MPIKEFWKLPGGMVDAHEDLSVAAVREVQEETGIKTKFVSLLGIRHAHNGRHSCSDMYIVCLMTPTHDQQTPVPQDGEVDGCKVIKNGVLFPYDGLFV
jgi:ADP-ribose pyrophosphatase YjhB (NUDIX family)